MAKVIEVKPHEDDKTSPVSATDVQCIIFLAGTIDMGNSEDWQRKFAQRLKTIDVPYEYIAYNPRRDEGFSNDRAELEYQVKWELERLEKSDRIIMYILGTSKSPITLMELGLFARTTKLRVICEPNFYRYDNVRLVCERYLVPLYTSMDEFFEDFKKGEEKPYKNGN